MEKRKYKVVIAQSGKLDVKEKRNISFSNLNTGSMQRRDYEKKSVNKILL